MKFLNIESDSVTDADIFNERLKKWTFSMEKKYNWTLFKTSITIASELELY